MPSDFHVKCPKCGAKMQYIAQWSMPKLGKLVYVCWKCPLGFRLTDLRKDKNGMLYEAELLALVRETK